MSKSSSKWATGCGIGCAVVIFLVILIVAGGYLLIRGVVKDFKLTDASMKALEERFGDVMDYSPDPGGAIPAERIEAFLVVRDSMEEHQAKIEETIGNFTQKITVEEGQELSSLEVFRIMRKGMGAIPHIAAYFTSRNEQLLAADMSLGEYYYLYIVCYYSWLGKSPGDGPKFRLMGSEKEFREYSWRAGGEKKNEDTTNWYGDEVIEARRLNITRYAHKVLLPMLENQLEKVQELESARRPSSFQRALRAEVAALQDDADRLPWQDGLPREMRDSLEPFRARLEASYSFLLNPLALQPEK